MPVHLVQSVASRFVASLAFAPNAAFFFFFPNSGGGGGEVTAAGRAWFGLVGNVGRSFWGRNVRRVLREKAALYKPRAWHNSARGSGLRTDACE